MKYFIILAGIALIASNFHFAHKSRVLHKNLIGQKQKYEQLSKHAASLNVTYSTQKRLLSVLRNKFSNEKGALKGNIKIISNSKFTTKEKARRTDTFDIVKKNVVISEIRYKNGPPIGYVALYKSPEKAVESKMYDHSIEVSTAVSRDPETGRYTIVSKADFILIEQPMVESGKKWVKHKFPLNITGGTALIDPTEKLELDPRFYWWAPHINASIGIGQETSVGLSYSLSGFGITKNDLKWKFVSLGVHKKGKEAVDFSIIPVTVRPWGNVLSNTYVGFGKLLNGGWFLGIEVGL